MKDGAQSNYESITYPDDSCGVLQSSRTTVGNYSNIQPQFHTINHAINPNEDAIKCSYASETSVKPKKSLKPRNRGSLTPVRRA